MRAFHFAPIVFALLLLTGCATDPAAVRSEFARGLAAYDAGDFKTAYGIWDDIRDEDLAALRNCAVMLRTGKGVAKDPGKAQDLMARAALAGLPTAADLGDMILKGEAAPPDAKSAVYWLKGAADAGHPVAAYELAGLYETGTGVDRNFALARKYYGIAADAGMIEAIRKLAELHETPLTGP
jgi:uncharacterized protein